MSEILVFQYAIAQYHRFETNWTLVFGCKNIHCQPVERTLINDVLLRGFYRAPSAGASVEERGIVTMG